MSAHGKNAAGSDRVEALLRAQDAAPWRAAPAGLHDRIMALVDASPQATAEKTAGGTSWRYAAVAASVAIFAGSIGLTIGAIAFRGASNVELIAAGDGEGGSQPEALPVEAGTHDAPTVLLARAFDDLKPAGSSRLVASVAAPMRSEVQGIAAETRLAARTVLSRLPFVSME